MRKGDVLNELGKVIGTHDGAEFLTLGQRHGFSVYQKTPDSPPLYVIQKNCEDNTVTVSERTIPDSKGNTIPLSDVHWIDTPVTRCYARLRYRQELFPVTVQAVTEDEYSVIPDVTQPYVSEGQSMVFYSDEECLGGGIIG